MRRILCLMALALGLNQIALADQPEPVESSLAAKTEKVSALLAERFGVARAKADEIADAVMKSASKYSLPPSLLLAVITIESRFREKAHGANGATGLMQIVPSSHRQLVKGKDLTEPTTNIETGSEILSGYVDSAGGDVEAGLRSYGGGKKYSTKVSNQAKVFEANLGETQQASSPDAVGSQGDTSSPLTVGSPVSIDIH
ncbi:transglycosylase SLT domain-containing protein [Pararobbsia silviterrae]|uniref:Lytic transglycosylase n=1 Tax=Pararobbsia silviterrae TaxID=1792498 RepID=A0A494XSC5_9BURK|nr:transglycosylase SLT domain-containing protein [Pararobbsia silviterrae]RKP51766.1 lytic transglycosylase [Pararobbsia silviterrae]